MNIYESIASRTGGDIYIGVVGPVRTGKSTFISRFMQKLVLPNIKEINEKIRAEDELPQSGSGKLVMTMQPKFVPNNAVEISVGENAKAKIRFVDCVGYLIDGVAGCEDEGATRLVKTPWSDEDIPFSLAAEIGTNKVIKEHSTIGVVVTTDGTITDLPRANYVDAEKRVIGELKELNKPFVVVLNSLSPESEETKKLACSLQEEYDVPVIAKNIELMNDKEFEQIIEEILFQFPIKQINFELPQWMRRLPVQNDYIQELLTKINSLSIKKMAQYTQFKSLFGENNDIKQPVVNLIDLATGEVDYEINVENSLFYKTLSDICKETIDNDYDLITFVESASIAKKEYNKLSSALKRVDETGYGVVLPDIDDLVLSNPEVVKKSGNSGLKLKAKASSLHIMKVDIETEVTPAVSGVGLADNVLNNENELGEEHCKAIWDTNMFGRSLSELAHDGIVAKLNMFPEEAQTKMRKTLSKIANEGHGGIICILL